MPWCIGKAAQPPAESASAWKRRTSIPSASPWRSAASTGSNEGKVRIRPELRELVRFRSLNLLGEWPFDEPFDLIFCRNVVIYFDDDVQRSLFDRFADSLVPGGQLVIGHSENLQRVCTRFRSLGQTIYGRVK